MAYFPDSCWRCSKSNYPRSKSFIKDSTRPRTVFLCRECEKELIESDRTFFYLKNGKVYPNDEKLEKYRKQSIEYQKKYEELRSALLQEYYTEANDLFDKINRLKSYSMIRQALTNIFSKQNVSDHLKKLLIERKQIYNQIFDPYKSELLSLQTQKEAIEKKAHEYRVGLSFGIPAKQWRYRKDKKVLDHLELLYEKKSVQSVLKRKDPVFQIFGNVIDLSRSHSKFIRRKKDYKRGNKIENFIKNSWYTKLIKVCEGKCVICKKEGDLQLDHFWLPKNEGANFVMVHSEEKYLVSNVMPLCPLCNASKRDKDIQRLLDKIDDEETIERMINFQIDTTIMMNRDNTLLKKVGEWYSVYPRSISSIFEIP